MRIIAGEARGRALKTREGKGTRPTDARTREALFNILATRLEGARFLDLYAGSGAMGLEALSRGAAEAVFVEINAVAANAIRANLRQLGWQEKARVWQSNVRSALPRLAKDGQQFDIIFADPPFSDPREVADFCTRIDNAPELLHNVGGQLSGVLILQHHWKFEPIINQCFSLAQQRRAGESTLSFYYPRPKNIASTAS